MKIYLEEACEEIDAALFSGDKFENKESQKELQAYLDRWQRALKELSETNGVIQ